MDEDLADVYGLDLRHRFGQVFDAQLVFVFDGVKHRLRHGPVALPLQF